MVKVTLGSTGITVNKMDLAHCQSRELVMRHLPFVKKGI